MSAQENAEAIIIVIKRFGKWFMFFVLALILLFLGIFAYESMGQYFSYDRHKELIKVETSFNKELCTSDFPLFIGIINNSTKKVMEVDVNVIVTRKGRSTRINNHDPFVSDFIIKANDSHGGCYSVYDDNFESPQILNGDGMDVKVSSYSVVFE